MERVTSVLFDKLRKRLGAKTATKDTHGVSKYSCNLRYFGGNGIPQKFQKGTFRQYAPITDHGQNRSYKSFGAKNLNQQWRMTSANLFRQTIVPVAYVVRMAYVQTLSNNLSYGQLEQAGQSVFDPEAQAASAVFAFLPYMTPPTDGHVMVMRRMRNQRALRALKRPVDRLRKPRKSRSRVAASYGYQLINKPRAPF